MFSTNFSTMLLQGNWHPLVEQTKKTASGVGPQWGNVTKQFEEQNIFTFDINLREMAWLWLQNFCQMAFYNTNSAKL